MDQVYMRFLEAQWEAGRTLAAQSSLLSLTPKDGPPPSRYVARLDCRGLVRAPDGAIVGHEGFEVGIRFPADYCRHANGLLVVTWLNPANVFHPNIGPGPGERLYICIGDVAASTPIDDPLLRIHELVTYQHVVMREDDALNRDACMYARAHQDRWPVDARTILGATVPTSARRIAEMAS
jgi:hypothetical protein